MTLLDPYPDKDVLASTPLSVWYTSHRVVCVIWNQFRLTTCIFQSSLGTLCFDTRTALCPFVKFSTPHYGNHHLYAETLQTWVTSDPVVACTMMETRSSGLWHITPNSPKLLPGITLEHSLGSWMSFPVLLCLVQLI